MSNRTVKQVWSEYIDAKRRLDWVKPEELTALDLDYLKSVDAHPDIIEAAKLLPGIDTTFIAADPQTRKYAPEDMFLNALLIADFQDGDYAYLLDARDPGSPVLSISHDPPRVEVIANNLVELIDGLTRGLQSPTYRSAEESEWGNYFDSLKAEARFDKDAPPFGLVHRSDDEFDYFDFRHARVGAMVSLTHRGKFTICEPSDEVGILKLGSESEARIRQINRRDQIWTIGVAAYAIGLFVYFLSQTPKGIVGSFVLAVIITLLTFMVVGTIMGAYADFQYRNQQRKKPD